MTDELKKVPAGILAERALRAAEVEPPKDATPVAPPTPSFALMPPDPNYREPTTLAKFTETHDKISRDAHAATTGEDVLKASMARKVLIDFLLGRVEQLENALKPFCVTGTMFANAQMCLSAAGDDESPAGGTWMSNPPAGIQLQPNASNFYRAVDAFGRAATEAHMVAIFQRVQEASALQDEKNQHVEDGGTVH